MELWTIIAIKRHQISFYPGLKQLYNEENHNNVNAVRVLSRDHIWMVPFNDCRKITLDGEMTTKRLQDGQVTPLESCRFRVSCVNILYRVGSIDKYMVSMIQINIKLDLYLYVTTNDEIICHYTCNITTPDSRTLTTVPRCDIRGSMFHY